MTGRDVARATPAGRDRVIDFVRAASLAVVILGHWLMATVTVTEAGIRGTSALAAMPWLSPLTWLLQIMPLFFVAGGFANLASWRSVQRRGGGYAGYLYVRVSRLMRPTLVFVMAVPLLLFTLPAFGVGSGEVALVGRQLGQPLWFLGVYVLVTALAPALAEWHERRPVAVLICLGLLAAGTDVLRFAGYEQVSYLNFGFGWLFAQQLGFWYADRRRLPRGTLWMILAGSIGMLAALTGPGPYPVSMVGQPGEMSNMNPPTVCLLMLTVGQAAALLLARPRLAAWLERDRPWSAVVVVGSMAMTLYLWHLLVLVLGFGILLWLDVALPAPGTAAWWLSRPAWWAVLAMILAVLAIWLARFERAAGHREHSGDGGAVPAGAGAVVVSAGLFGVVLGGLELSIPLVVSLAALVFGLAVTAWAARVNPHRTAGRRRPVRRHPARPDGQAGRGGPERSR